MQGQQEPSVLIKQAENFPPDNSVNCQPCDQLAFSLLNAIAVANHPLIYSLDCRVAVVFP